MYPNNFFLPNQALRLSPMTFNQPNTLNLARNGGLFSSLRRINWSNLLSGANKTLNVVNQAIPIVKQAGPMINNMKSMIKIASVFKDETDPPAKKNTIIENNSNLNTNNNKANTTTNSNDILINQPNFFI